MGRALDVGVNGHGGGQTDGLAVKTTRCSRRGLGFAYNHLFAALVEDLGLLTITCTSSSRGSNTLCRSLHTCDEHKLSEAQAHTHKFKNKYFKWPLSKGYSFQPPMELALASKDPTVLWAS